MTDCLRSVLLDVAEVALVRVVNAPERDLQVVQRQLGATQLPERDTAVDITVRFVEELSTTSPVNVGIGECSFDAASFFVCAPRQGVAAGRAAFPMDHIGSGIELVCERRLRSVPHLVTLVNLVALARDMLPLHASAFTDGDSSFLVTGWSKSGKTEALVGAMTLHPDLRYVGDEWVYLSPDGSIRGLPEPIRLWDWHLRQRPELLAKCSRAQRTRLTALRVAVTGSRSAGRTLPSEVESVQKLTAALRRQANVQLLPRDLFGAERVVGEAKLDQVVLLLAGESQHWDRRPAEPGEVADRMRASLLEERSRFMSHYRQFQYAFPHRSSPLVETAPALEHRMLQDRLGNAPAVVIRHPYPCDIVRLGSAVVDAGATERPTWPVGIAP